MSAVLPGGASVPAGSGASVPAGSGAAASVARPIVEPHLPSAAERLEASRQRLRSALLEIARPPTKPSFIDDLKLGSFGTQMLDRLKALPGVAIALDVLEHWWAEHPLHAAGSLAEQAARRYVGPFAKKNPLAIVAGGVALGALLAYSKPWRWLLRPALLAGLMPQLASQVLKRLPLDAWLQMVSTLTGKRTAAKAPVPAQASPLPKES